MASPQWRNRLIEAVRRQRLPRVYAQRLIDELSDHAADIFRENSGMDAECNLNSRLGEPEQLAAAAGMEYRRRTFAARHPLLTFLAGPPLVVLAALVLSLLLAFAGLWLIDAVTGGSLSANDDTGAPPSAFETSVMQVLNFAIRIVPFALSAWLFVRFGRRAGLHGWTIAACGLVALSALSFFSVLDPATADSRATWRMGFAWPLSLDRLLQAAVPLVLPFWLLWPSIRRRGAASSATAATEITSAN